MLMVGWIAFNQLDTAQSNPCCSDVVNSSSVKYEGMGWMLLSFSVTPVNNNAGVLVLNF